MRHKIAPVLAIVVAAVFAVPFLARPAASLKATPRLFSRQSGNSGKTPPPLISKKHPIGDQVAEGGLWRMDSNFQPVFMLKNLLEVAPITVTPVLYMADGTEYDMTPVNLDPAGVAMVNIKDALADAPTEIQMHISAYGSAGIKSQWVWPAVFGAIRNSDDVRGLLYQTHLEANANFTHDPLTPQSQQLLESAWWKQDPNVTGYLTLTNTSLKPIAVSVKITDNLASASAGEQYTIAPHATTWIDFAPFWAQFPTGPTAGGLEIAYTGSMRAITASGGMEDASKGYSHMLHFEIPDSIMTSEVAAHLPANLPASMKQAQTTGRQSNTYASTGIMMGTQEADMQFPQGTVFSPYLIFRNTTANPLVVQLAANTMTASNPLDVPLGNITLAGFESRQVDMHSILNASKLARYNGYINLQSTFIGAPGDLLQESGSVDQTLNYVFEVPPHLEQTTGTRTMNYWNTSGDTDTMFTLFNHGSTAQDVVLTLQHQEGKYEVTIHLEPHASVTISAGKLIRSGAPDRNGNVIPASIVQGSAKISGPTGSMKERFSVDVSTGIFNARTGTCSYACCSCDPIEEVNIDPEPSSVIQGGEEGLGLWCVDSFGRGDNCSYYYDSWESDNTSVATVSDGIVTGAAVGGANVTAFISVTGPSAWGGENCCGTYGCPPQVLEDTSAVTVNTADVVIIAWVNASAITLPSGENSSLQAALSTSLTCASTELAWSEGSAVLIDSLTDAAYADAFLVKNSGNSQPPSTNPASVLSSNINYRLYNRFQASFTQSGGYVSNFNPSLQSVTQVGASPDPCGIASPLAGQYHEDDGVNGIITAGTKVYQLNEGQIGSTGQDINMTINGTTTPWIWSVIEFDASGTLNSSNHAIFPTYDVYVNGTRVTSYAQSALSTFIAETESYQLLPSSIN